MTAFQEPLEKGWLRTVLNDVREEVNGWTAAAHQQRPVERGENEPADRTLAEKTSSK
jgi:hypothetical protein